MKARDSLEQLAERIRGLADTGKARIDDAQVQRRRNALLQKLGRVHYDAQGSGPSESSTRASERLIAQLDALNAPDDMTRAHDSEDAHQENSDDEDI